MVEVVFTKVGSVDDKAEPVELKISVTVKVDKPSNDPIFLLVTIPVAVGSTAR